MIMAITQGNFSLIRILVVLATGILLLLSDRGYAMDLDSKSKKVLRDIVFLKSEEGYRLKKLARWGKSSVNIGVISHNGLVPGDAGAAIVDFIRQTYIPNVFELTLHRDKPIDILIIFSDQIFEDAKGKHRESLKSVFVPGAQDQELDEFVDAQHKNKRECFSYASAQLNYELSGSVIFISTNTDQKIMRRCIALEGLRSLGMLGFTTNPEFETVMSIVKIFYWMTDTDIRFLKYLYQNTLPGTGIKDF